MMTRSTSLAPAIAEARRDITPLRWNGAPQHEAPARPAQIQAAPRRPIDHESVHAVVVVLPHHEGDLHVQREYTAVLEDGLTSRLTQRINSSFNVLSLFVRV